MAESKPTNLPAGWKKYHPSNAKAGWDYYRWEGWNLPRDMTKLTKFRRGRLKVVAEMREQFGADCLCLDYGGEDETK